MNAMLEARIVAARIQRALFSGHGTAVLREGCSFVARLLITFGISYVVNECTAHTSGGPQQTRSGATEAVGMMHRLARCAKTEGHSIGSVWFDARGLSRGDSRW